MPGEFSQEVAADIGTSFLL